MAKEHVEGTVDKAGGTVKEGLGKATGDRDLQAEGRADQAEGSLKKAFGSMKDAVRNVMKR
jgi:uncharacterized protein YjbJ (UPF0337 family)